MTIVSQAVTPAIRFFGRSYGKARLEKGGIMTETRIRTPEDLIAVLRSGDYALIKTYD